MSVFTEKQYREELTKFCQSENFIEADEAYFAELDRITDGLKEMIIANTDDLTTDTGTTYYVSMNGDDNNDGKSPSSPICTIERLNTIDMNEGDLVVFERGGLWRGMVEARNGVSYSAYGVGPKPKIFKAYDGINDAKWIKTEHENVWCFDKVYDDKDIGVIVLNDGESYAEKKLSIAELKSDLDFIYSTEWTNEENPDNKVYLYCSKGNPAEVFWQIDLSRAVSIIKIPFGAHDIHIKNLELRYAQDIFFVTRGKNISMSYCVCGWTGGDLGAGKDHQTRFGGGAGGWHSCDTMTFDHCYIYQQFDSGVTPQYHWRDEDAGVFKNFITTDCLFEKVEYTLEYFHTQLTAVGNGYENMYFGYNICRTGGYGFGDKTEQSRYVKSWGHENVCHNCQIEYNVFDRAASLSIEIIGHDHDKRGNEVSYDHIPKLNNNVYIEPKDKVFANINKILYKFNEASYITLEKLGVDKDSLYVYTK